MRGRSSEWVEILTNQDDNLRLLICRQSTDNISIPVDTLRPALLDHAEKMLRGEIKASAYQESWKFVVSALKPISQKKLCEFILNSLKTINTSRESLEEFCFQYDALLENLPFTDNPNTSLDKFFGPLISTTNAEIRRFLTSQDKIIRRCLAKADEESRESFKEIAEGIAENNDAINDGWVKDLEEITGFTLIEQKGNDQQDSAA